MNCMVRNFIFHRVVPVVSDSSLEMSVQLFDKCIQFINRRYQVIGVEDILQANRLPVGGKPFASLTFDDGYACNIQYAAPILHKYHCRASFYVVTNCVDQNIPIWGYLLEHLLMHTQKSSIQISDQHLPKHLKLHNIPANPAQRILYIKKLKAWLISIAVAIKETVFNEICGQITDVEIPRMMMNWNDLAALRSEGHYIGSHTHTHNALTGIDNDVELKKELVMPREIIQQKLGYLPVSIAYPFGFNNARVRQMTAESGYQMGIASERHQLYYQHKHDFFEIPRIALSNEPWYKTRMRITNRIEEIKNILPRGIIKFSKQTGFW